MKGVCCLILCYYGGKWKFVFWIIQYLVLYYIYVEFFGGVVFVLFWKVCSYVEIYNDFDGDVVNLFCVVWDYGE